MDYSGGASAAGLSVGNLVINLTMNTAGLSKSLDEANKQLRSLSSIAASQFAAAGGAAGAFGEKVSQVSNGIRKAFGDDAPALMQKFGRELKAVFGVSATEIKGLSQIAGSLEGVFKTVGAAAALISAPITAALAAAIGLAAALGAVKNAMGAGAGAGTGTASSINQWALKNVPGAQLADDAWEGAKSKWRQSAATPGTVAETVSKMDPVADIKAALASALDSVGLKDIISKLMKPGQSAADVAKASAEAEKHAAKVRESAEKTFNASVLAGIEAEQEAIDKINIANEELRKASLDSIAMQEDFAAEMRDEASAQAEIMSQAYKDAGRATVEALENGAADMQRRWSALGSGQIGTALGAEGLGGSILDQIGGKASQGELTGTVMQGASAGGQAGGPWGALIGAIIALALETKSFSSVMSSIEGILAGVLPILDQAVRPLAIALDGIGKILSPILNIVGWLAEVLMTVARPLDAINNLLAPISDLLNRLIDKIDISGVMDAQVTDSNGNSMSWTDAITGTGLIDAAASEITKAINGGSDRPATEAEVKIANEWLGGNGEYQRMMDQYNAVMAAQAEAKKKETDEANRAAAALKELADSVYNSAPGYKLNAVMYAASDRAGGTGGAGNPYGGG